MSDIRSDADDANAIYFAPATRLLPENQSLSTRKPPRKWRKRKPSHALLIFLSGLLLGILIPLLFLLFVSGYNLPVAANLPPNQVGNVTVQIQPATILPLIKKSFQQAGMGNDILSLNLQLASGDQATLTGDYTINVLGLDITRPFTIVAQPLAVQCRLQIRVLQASLSGISITRLVTSFETTINQQLQSLTQSGTLHYCITGVQTNPNALFLILQVKTS